jgi:cytochrome c oxidase subunit IV
MATDTSTTTSSDHGTEHAEDHHPTPQSYVQIAIVLAILTGLEVAASYVDIGPAFLPTLIGLMLIKFVLVAGWFMHLKYDTRLYTRFMVTGLVLAVSLYATVLVLFSTAVRA